ncbi:hypothetical protein DesfrDRAFT_3320 [Solidesulfovibrio fructosivorans JJ]]|uniref:Uncharacterized protein n=1 Tax=Solidesulfovibrio fructosivorans JJ] TaxID=596151 RepID=E1K0C0_SOLFR|nr:hypothetical protein [Solidesulfovibrio fructosivorans]EFL49951.1 hypothetical protein DesfrDRAFT_3320 [Solidesulfovibrio fructosivorans JJ]]
MRKNIAITVLSIVFIMNIGSGYTRRIDRQLSKVESSLGERFDDRAFVEQALEAERKLRSRLSVSAKA